ncbi:IclR family transcriptional regulator [Sphingomonas sp. dw_22]|uniref:IclR family transcriptional regulator n=1 Tax=Sphingomonas sp. dw_22 TaxID=2721175 RepID=UPI001BD6505D|nr:IclR family transcriptional regulator [Sphingomonas sp. dw_22]
MTVEGEQKPLKNTYSAPALEKGFDVLELLADHPAGLTMTEIAAGLDRSINELFRLVVVMERRGYLRKVPETDRYRVTYHVLDLAYRATPVQDLTHVAAPVMYDLAHAVLQSCHLVVPAESRGLVVLRQENPGPTGFSVRLGAPIDLLQSCSGNVLLAFTDADRLYTLLGARSGEAPAALAEVEPVLAAIRAHGFERRPSPMTHGVIDISYPVFGFDGHLAAALTIPFLERIDGSQPVAIDAGQALLAEAAHAVSAGLGWYGASEG